MLTRDPRHTATVIITSLMPWLIDFDQDFAMYLANAIKFFIVMSPFIYFIQRSENKSLD